MDKTVIQFVFSLRNLFLGSSIGRKAVMALTGLGAVGFVAVHLSGNVLLFKGESAFNTYAEHLHSLPILPLMEMGLAGLFAVHVSMGLYVTYLNWKARPVSYQAYGTSGQATVASQTMIYSGLVILAFLFFHLWTIKISFLGDVETKAWDKVSHVMGSGFNIALYLVGFVALGLHLFHGIKSTTMSLGLRHPTHNAWIDLSGKLIGVGLAAAFAAIALKFLCGVNPL